MTEPNQTPAPGVEVVESGIATVSAHDTRPAVAVDPVEAEVVHAALVSVNRGKGVELWPVRRYEARNINEFCLNLKAEIEAPHAGQEPKKVDGIVIVPVLHVEQYSTV